ncbi:MAG: tetratricopeptide repeat protein [Bdellovibrionaceae bacterium]|nr:tetratricopeptide repeat protein [Pseudobdellovibrionaceae bacterium]MDW8191177.1 tetratricopeptide repeat protein [Pseudobdellovibrionaceae bacterium]
MFNEKIIPQTRSNYSNSNVTRPYPNHVDSVEQSHPSIFTTKITPTFMVHALNFDPSHPWLLKLCLSWIKSYYHESNAHLKIASLLAHTAPTLTNLVTYGKILDQKNMCLEAINFFEQALLKKPKEDKILFEIYNFLGNAYLKLLDYESAEENYHKAFTINPHSSQLNVNLGTLAIHKNDWYRVQYYFREALKLDLKNDKAWTGLAMYHHYLGDLELAIASVKKALDINPSNRPALLLLAQWNSSSKIQETINYIARYLDENHFDEEISILFIHFCVRNQDFDLAEIEMEKLVCLNPKNIKYYEMYQELQEANNESKRISKNCPRTNT